MRSPFRWKAFLLAFGISLLASPWGAHAQEQAFDQDKDIRTGPEVGGQVPSFRALDQNGNWQTLDSLKGPKGLMLVFHRSADW
ncbi:MAG: hypothetical protein ACE5HV_12485 [Acidobacteriota bacterium]